VIKEHGLCGSHLVCPGDWIIEGAEKGLYSCRSSVFEAMYVEVDSRRMLPTTPGEIEGIEKEGG
jgi:hypothetical protein